jgi:hypothetical protein
MFFSHYKNKKEKGNQTSSFLYCVRHQWKEYSSQGAFKIPTSLSTALKEAINAVCGSATVAACTVALSSLCTPKLTRRN